MEIIIRTSVPKYASKHIDSLLKQALDFMKSKYPNTNFDNMRIIFTRGNKRSRYSRNNHKKDLLPTVRIEMRDLLWVYDIKSLNIKQCKVKTGLKIQTLSTLVHELTHHYQGENGLKYGEVLTTKNELEFIEQNFPDIYIKMMGNKK